MKVEKIGAKIKRIRTEANPEIQQANLLILDHHL